MAFPMRLPILDPRLALRGVDPRFAATEELADDPAGAVVASAPSSMDSILFPRQPSAGILTPEDRAAIKRNTILQVAAGLLQAGGRSPNQRGTLANIGSALAGIDLPGATQSALRMRAAVDELNERASARAAFERVSAKYPAMPGENAEQRFARLSNMVSDPELALAPGAADIIGKLSNVLAQIGPELDRGQLKFGIPVGAPEGTKPQLYRVRQSGPPEPVGLEGQEFTPYQLAQLGFQRETADRPTNPELQNAALGVNAGRAHLAMRRIEDTNPGAVAEVSTIVRSGRVAGAIPVVGPALDEAIRAGKAPALSPSARQLLASLNSFVAAVVPGRGGQALTFHEIKLFMDEFVRDPGDDPETAAQKVANRIGRLREQKVRGRRAWQEALDVFGLSDDEIFGDAPTQDNVSGAAKYFRP